MTDRDTSPITRSDLAEMEARIMNSIHAQGIAIATTMGERFESTNKRIDDLVVNVHETEKRIVKQITASQAAIMAALAGKIADGKSVDET